MTSYAHGVPSWVDLATPDPDAAKAFYGALFGWEFEARPTDTEGVDYTMAVKDGSNVAGMMQLMPEMAAAGMPPVWSTYINVADLDAAVARVAPAGGDVRSPAMDVMDSGRMAIVADPTGAVVGLWQAKDHIGADLVNEHGAVTWNELLTSDVDAASSFYRDVVGWTAQAVPMPTGEYTLFHADGGNTDGIAGAMASPMPGMPSFWGVYFFVDDVEATVEAATAAGAQVMMEATAMEGVGTLATLVDPQGAAFSIMHPAS
jgi:hypothetical protein